MTRSDLRLAVVAGLTNGLAAISGLPYGFYGALAVLAVCTGSYGNAIDLGRQRLLGTLLGGAVLVLGLEGLRGVPLPLGLGISLGLMRLIGGLLGLKVGYKVGGIVVVMGTLVHRQQVFEWLPLRLFWTALGIIIATLSLQLIWPARAIVASERAMASLLENLATDLGQAAAGLDAAASADGPASSGWSRGADPGLTAAPQAAPPAPGAEDLDLSLSQQSPPQSRRLIEALGAFRRSLPQARQELGANPQRHPRIRLLNLLDGLCSQLIGLWDDLLRHPLPPLKQDGFAGLRSVEVELLLQLSARLTAWTAVLRRPEPLAWEQPPPSPEGEAFAWQRLEALLQRRDLSEPDLPVLERHAGFLSLLGLAERQLAETERRWRDLSASV